MNLNNYLQELASSASTPGGGSASAVSAMLGISLMEMAVALTKDKKKFSEFADLYQEVQTKWIESKQICQWGMDEDAKAFSAVMKLYKTPSEEASDDHQEKLQAATIYAAEVPLKVAKAIEEALKAAEKVMEKLNPWVVSDLIGGVEIAMAALRSVLLNVAINIKSIDDENQKNLVNSKMQTCLKESEATYLRIRKVLYANKTFSALG